MTEWAEAEKNTGAGPDKQLLLVVAMEAELPADRLPELRARFGTGDAG